VEEWEAVSMMAQNDPKIGEDKMVEFLTTEYTQCYTQIRHHETVSDTYLKYAISGYPVIIGGISALYTILDAGYRNIIVSILLLFTLAAGAAVLALLLTNRSYYVVMARQINAIRKFFIEHCEKLDFSGENRAYLDPTQPTAYNPSSSSTFLFYIIYILNCLVGAGSLYFLLYHFEVYEWLIWTSCVVFAVVLFLLQKHYSIEYLNKKDKEHKLQTKKEPEKNKKEPDKKADAKFQVDSENSK
jgi:hypothetical protein